MSTSSGPNRRSPLILALDTAGSACSVAVGCDAVLTSASRPMRHGHAEALLPMIDTVVREAGLSPASLGIIAASTGPGGFTGIRVGLAAARGIATAIGVPLIGISSFAAVAAKVATPFSRPPILIALDSRRSELYVQPLSGSGEPLARPAAVLPDDLAQFAAITIGTGPLLLAGDAVNIAASVLAAHADVEVVAASAPDALGVLAAARCAWCEGAAPEPVRPLYVRAPDVTLAKTGPVALASNSGTEK